MQVRRREAEEGRVVRVEVGCERGGDRRGREEEVERVVEWRRGGAGLELGVEGHGLAAGLADLGEQASRRLLEVRICNGAMSINR